MKHLLLATILVCVFVFGVACNSQFSPAAPSSLIGLPGGGGPLAVTPRFALVDLRYLDQTKGQCYYASGGDGHYNWSLDPNKITGASGFIFGNGREGCFRPNGPTTIEGILRSGDGQEVRFNGNFY